MQYLIKNKYFPTENEFLEIYKINNKYIIQYFFWEFQKWINLLYLNKNITFYEKYNKKFNEDLQLIFLSKNLLNKFLLKIRSFNIIKKFTFTRYFYVLMFKFIKSF